MKVPDEPTVAGLTPGGCDQWTIRQQLHQTLSLTRAEEYRPEEWAAKTFLVLGWRTIFKTLSDKFYKLIVESMI